MNKLKLHFSRKREVVTFGEIYNFRESLIIQLLELNRERDFNIPTKDSCSNEKLFLAYHTFHRRMRLNKIVYI